MSLDKERVAQIESDFLAIRKEYMALEVGYVARNHLQHIRKQLTELFTQCGELVKGTKHYKVWTELYRQIVISEQMLEVIEANENTSVSKADKEARTTSEYRQHVEDTAEADSDWESVRHLIESIKMYILTVASDIQGINDPPY